MFEKVNEFLLKDPKRYTSKEKTGIALVSILSTAITIVIVLALLSYSFWLGFSALIVLIIAVNLVVAWYVSKGYSIGYWR